MSYAIKLSESEIQLADLYLLSGTVKFGAFKIAAHEEQPNLPLTPMYMHYPKTGENGDKYLPEIFNLIGGLFAEIITKKKLQFDKICAIPSGADPLAFETAKVLQLPESKILRFSKVIGGDGRRQFSGPIAGKIDTGDTVLILDDHTSGGYTKSLFTTYLNSLGAHATDVLTVIDREQGAVKYLRKQGITIHSILTITDLVNHYVVTGQISKATAEKVSTYIVNNQIQIS